MGCGIGRWLDGVVVWGEGSVDDEFIGCFGGNVEVVLGLELDVEERVVVGMGRGFDCLFVWVEVGIFVGVNNYF